MNNVNIDAKTLDMCLKEIGNIGSTTYQNICTGVSKTVQWGQIDWIMMGFFISLFLFIIGFIIIEFIPKKPKKNTDLY